MIAPDEAPSEQRETPGRKGSWRVWILPILIGLGGASLTPGPVPAMILFTGFTAILIACGAGIIRSILKTGRR